MFSSINIDFLGVLELFKLLKQPDRNNSLLKQYILLPESSPNRRLPNPRMFEDSLTP